MLVWCNVCGGGVLYMVVVWCNVGGVILLLWCDLCGGGGLVMFLVGFGVVWYDGFVVVVLEV